MSGRAGELREYGPLVVCLAVIVLAGSRLIELGRWEPLWTVALVACTVGAVGWVVSQVQDHRDRREGR